MSYSLEAMATSIAENLETGTNSPLWCSGSQPQTKYAAEAL